jgi:ketosteroid isomerase-like protein
LPVVRGAYASLVTAGNVSLVQAAIDAYNRRDVQRLCELMTDDVDLQPPVSWLTGRAYRGHEGIAEWLRDVDDSFSWARIAPLELTDLGDRVLAITRFDVEGHESGVAFGSELGLVIGVERGRIGSWVGFTSHAEARARATGERTIQ